MNEQKKESRMRRRIRAVFWGLWIIFLLLILRLFQVQVVQAHRFSKMANLEHREKLAIPAIRGSIFDRHGNLLAMSLTGQSIAAFPQKIKNKSLAAEKLSLILGIKENEIRQWIQTSSSFVWIARKVNTAQAEEVKNLKMPGIEIVKEPTGRRFYPMGNLACHVLGYTGIDDQGLDGVELYYDKALRGNPGYLLADTDGLGRIMPQGISQISPAIPGANLTLTIDSSLQYIAEHELAREIKQTKAQDGVIIIMDPENGEVLALANYPSFNSNNYSRFPAGVLRDRAITDDYEPGSTFKAILAAAALDSGKINMDETFLSGPAIKIDSWTINNAEDGFLLGSPQQNLESIITNSLNVGAASVALKIGVQTFADMIAKFGFFRKTDIDLPGEVTSIAPPPKDWKNIQLATIGFGQGIAVTPIQMATAYATIANGGYPVHPHLLKAITLPDGTQTEEPSSREKEPIMKPETAEEVKYLLSQVVAKGTGTKAIIPGFTVAGKTGTAQMSQSGGYSSNAYVASFIGFVPVEKPALAILVKIDKPQFPHWGGTVSAPVFQRVAQEALWRLQIPPSAGMTRFGTWKIWNESTPKE